MRYELGQEVEYAKPGIRTPGFVLSEMDTVDYLVKSLVRDVVSANFDDVRYRQELAAFALDWQSFYDANRQGVGAWWARGTTPVYEKVLEYRRGVDSWRDEYLKRGGTISSPDPRKAARKSSSLWPYLLGGTAALLAVWWVFSPSLSAKRPKKD